MQSELPQYEERIAAQRKLAEQELVENFILRLREQIEDARQQLGHLNTTLATRWLTRIFARSISKAGICCLSD